MTDLTSNLALPLIAASQAQKHVTHNQALDLLDLIVQAIVQTRTLTAPPGSPADGQIWIPKSVATGAWAGKENKLAAWQGGAWVFVTPQTGWRVWVLDKNAVFVWTGTAWQLADGANGLLASSAAVNFNSANNDTSIAIELPAGCTRWTPDALVIADASHSLTTATFGLFTAAAGAGIAIVAAATAISVSATANNAANSAQRKDLSASTIAFDAASVFFRVGTGEGAPATGNVTLFYRPLP